MKTIIITRKYWGQNRLRSIDGTRCCLGFVCEALGIPAKNTLGTSYPDGLTEDMKKTLPNWLLTSGQGSDCLIASEINDDGNLSMAEKEKRLKIIFLNHDIKLVFRGKP